MHAMSGKCPDHLCINAAWGKTLNQYFTLHHVYIDIYTPVRTAPNRQGIPLTTHAQMKNSNSDHTRTITNRWELIWKTKQYPTIVSAELEMHIFTKHTTSSTSWRRKVFLTPATHNGTHYCFLSASFDRDFNVNTVGSFCFPPPDHMATNCNDEYTQVKKYWWDSLHFLLKSTPRTPQWKKQVEKKKRFTNDGWAQERYSCEATNFL